MIREQSVEFSNTFCYGESRGVWIKKKLIFYTVLQKDQGVTVQTFPLHLVNNHLTRQSPWRLWTWWWKTSLCSQAAKVWILPSYSLAVWYWEIYSIFLCLNVLISTSFIWVFWELTLNRYKGPGKMLNT
jgi:hypothetical protein